MTTENPWISCFERLNSADTIKTLSARLARPLFGLADDPPEVACDRIAKELSDIFSPTVRTTQILQGFVQYALSHAKQHYSSAKMFMQRSYERNLSFEPVMPIILTGPAGTGKSQLCKALLRMVGEPTTVTADPTHPPFPLVGVRRVVVQSRKSVAEVLRPLARPLFPDGLEGVDPETGLGGTRLFQNCVRWQYQCGVCLLMPDELQFISQSATANALLASIVLQFTYFGIPLVFVGNYSVLHRLMARPQEERQRMLGRLFLLLPDSPDSPDWSDILDEYERALPDLFSFKFSQKKHELWSFCAGLKRELLILLVLSYRQARRRNCFVVNWSAVENSYRSFEFSAQREDVELMIGQMIDGKKKRKDLWCPLPIPDSATEEYRKALRESRTQRVAKAVQCTAMTAEERRVQKKIEGTISDQSLPKKTRAVRINAAQRTAESLTAATKKLRDSGGR